MNKSLLIVAALLLVFVIAAVSTVVAVPKGAMFFFDARECPAGWSEFEPAAGRLLVSVADPSNAGLTVGMPLKDREDRTHAHTTTLTGNLPYKHIAGAGGGNHEGAVHGSVGTTFPSEGSPSGLPFTQLVFCRVDDSHTNDQPMAMGTVAYFDAEGSSSGGCPAAAPNSTSQGWRAVEALDGRIAVPGFQNGGGGNPNNQPKLRPGEQRAHNHTSVRVPVQEDSKSYVGIDGCCNDGPAPFDKHFELQGAAEEAGSELPYLQTMTCASQAESFELVLPAGALVFNELECPEGWEVALETAGRFLVPLPKNGVPGAFFGGESLTPTGHAADPLHLHQLRGNVSFPSCGIELASGCCAGGYAGSGDFAVVGQTTSADVAMPFSMFPLCRCATPGCVEPESPRGAAAKHDAPLGKLRKFLERHQ